MGGVFQGFPSPFNVWAASAGESGNDGAADDCGDCLDGFEIAIGGNGESGFDHVGAEAVELVRQAQLFLMIHATTGRLFSIAQRCIENGDANLFRSHNLPYERSSSLSIAA
jgi:hypothetical protein